MGPAPPRPQEPGWRHYNKGKFRGLANPVGQKGVRLWYAGMACLLLNELNFVQVARPTLQDPRSDRLP